MGASGRKTVHQWLPRLKEEFSPELIVANGENAAHGFGITPSIAQEILQSGVHVITGGNHTWDKKEVKIAFEKFPQILIRPANYPPNVPGKGITVVQGVRGTPIGIINLMGRTFMEAIDCPFRTFDREIEGLRAKTKIILLDMHAEATSEKVAMGQYADGRVSAVVGSHTHIQTADEKILFRGTGYLSDAGMNGPDDSIIGMKSEIILRKFLTKIHEKVEVADGPATLHGVVFSIDSESGQCKAIHRVQRKPFL